MSDRILSMNERDTLPLSLAKADLLAVLDRTKPTLGGLQEWGAARDHILEASGYSWTRPNNGGGPVLWDETRYSLHACRGIRLSRGEFVGHLPGRRSKLGASIATEVILNDVEGGGQTVLLNAHLTAEVQVGKGYRTDLAHRLRVMRHKREKRRLGRRARWHKRRSRRVRVVLDGNYDGLTLGGFVSCWTDHHDGTLGPRAVDIVFADRKPSQPPRTFHTHSDHRAVVVTY